MDPIQFLVLDEADRLMDLGFEKDIAKICDYVKTKRDDFLRSRLQTVRAAVEMNCIQAQVSAAPRETNLNSTADESQLQ